MPIEGWDRLQPAVLFLLRSQAVGSLGQIQAFITRSILDYEAKMLLALAKNPDDPRLQPFRATFKHQPK